MTFTLEVLRFKIYINIINWHHAKILVLKLEWTFSSRY